MSKIQLRMEHQSPDGEWESKARDWRGDIQETFIIPGDEPRETHGRDHFDADANIDLSLKTGVKIELFMSVVERASERLIHRWLEFLIQ
jgi:hypothetical protein